MIRLRRAEKLIKIFFCVLLIVTLLSSTVFNCFASSGYSLSQAPVPGDLSLGLYNGNIFDGSVNIVYPMNSFLVDPLFFTPDLPSQYSYSGTFIYDNEFAQPGTTHNYASYEFVYNDYVRYLDYADGYYSGWASSAVYFRAFDGEDGSGINTQSGLVLTAHDFFASYNTFDSSYKSEVFLSFDVSYLRSYGYFGSSGSDYDNISVVFDYYLINEVDQLIAGKETVVLPIEQFFDGEYEYVNIDVGDYLRSTGVLSASRPLAYISSFYIAFPITDAYDLDNGWYPRLEFDVIYSYDPSLNVNMFARDETLPFHDYTAFLATAASGFLNLQIFPGFTISGLLISLLGFACAIWFLKIFAGG